MFRARHLILALILLLPHAAKAQHERDTLYALPEVTIVATRFALSANAAPARVTHLDRAAMDRTGSASVGDALERHGAGFLRRYGPAGLIGLSIRGTGSSHTAVFVDGQRLSDPQLGQIDLSLLPVAFVSAVELLQGGGSARFGSAAVAASLNLSTLSAERSGVRLITRAGAWGERSVSAAYRGYGARTDVTLALEFGDSDGDFSYVDKSRFPPARRERTNADRLSRSVFAKLRHRGVRSVTEISSWFLFAERGLPPIAGGPSTDERQWDEHGRFWVTQRWSHSKGITTIQASAQRSSIRYSNPIIDLDEEGVAHSFTLEGFRDQTVNASLRFSSGVDLAIQSASHPSLDDRSRQFTAAVHTSAVVVVGRNVRIYPSARSDWFFRDGHVTTSVNPAARVWIGLGARNNWALKGGVERSFRVPTFNDLHWRGAGAAGNLDLTPESGISADVGVALRQGKLIGDVTAFFQSIRDRITWLPDAGGIWTPENVGLTESLGVEASVRGTVAAGGAVIYPTASYEYVHSADRSDPETATYGRPLRYVPRHTLRTSLDTDVASVTAGISGRFTGRRYVTEDGSMWLDPYLVLDARVGWRLRIGGALLEPMISVENAGSTEFEVVAGYPMPPRHLRLQLLATF